MDEPDIWRAAHQLIERHVNDRLAAAMEVEHRDPAGEARAKRVLGARRMTETLQ